MSFFSSRSVLCRHTSTTCAPPRTCLRAISLASSHFSSATRFLGNRENVLFRRPTATPDEVQPAVISEFLQLCRHCRGRSEVLSFFVRQSGIWIAGHKFA